MNYNCDYCKKYWEFIRSPYYSKLLSMKEEAVKDIVLFCPACRVSKVRKDRWIKGNR